MTRYERSCSIRGDGGRAIRNALDRVGDKWTLLVVATLGDEHLRFTELMRRVPGISQRMLTRTVRQLERNGLVRRQAFAEVPPRVEYSLTDTGRTLIAPAAHLAEWAIEHQSEIDSSRRTYDSADAPKNERSG